MISSIRKEIARWKLVLWPVLISLVAGSFLGFSQLANSYDVITVNGLGVTREEFNNKLRAAQLQISSIRETARAQGMDPQFLLKLYGMSDPAQFAVERCINDKTLDSALLPLGIDLDNAFVSEEVRKQLPQFFFDQDGNLNMQVYQSYISSRQMHISEFELEQEESFKRDILTDIAAASFYLPASEENNLFHKDDIERKFKFYTVSFDAVRGVVNKQDFTDEDFKAYYTKNRDKYLVPEKREGSFWVIDALALKNSVGVSEDEIRSFYDKNRSTSFRISPRVKIAQIFIDGISQESEQKAVAIKEELEVTPEKFGEYAVKYSGSGATLDYFQRGTHDAALEKEAFRMKTPGVVSGVIKTEKGFAIIKLIDRISAREKELSEVRKEIEEAVTAKKAREMLRTKIAMASEENNATAAEELIKLAKKSSKISLTAQYGHKHTGMEQTVVNKLFAVSKENLFASFTHDERFVLCRLDRIASSYVQEYDVIASQVKRDCKDNEAVALMDNVVKRLKKALLKKDGVDELVKKYNVSINTTSFLAPDSKEIPSDIRGYEIKQKAFGLTHSAQVAVGSSGKSKILVTLEGIRMDDEAVAVTEKETALKTVSGQHKQDFVASLRRSATIIEHQKVLPS